MFPFYKQYLNWLKNIKHFSEFTIYLDQHIIEDFFDYFRDTTSLENVTAVTKNSIEDYLVYLGSTRKLQKNTINKYLISLKRYFSYAYTSGLNDKYPLANIRGFSLEREKEFVINWEDHIAEMIWTVSPETIFLLTAIALGYKNDELLSLNQNVVSKVSNDEVRRFLTQYLNYHAKTDAFFITRHGTRPKSLQTIFSHVKEDEKVLRMPLTVSYLRQSYIYSKVIDRKLNDKELMAILRCSSRSIAYYKTQANKYRFKIFTFKDEN